MSKTQKLNIEAIFLGTGIAAGRIHHEFLKNNTRQINRNIYAHFKKCVFLVSCGAIHKKSIIYVAFGSLHEWRRK